MIKTVVDMKGQKRFKKVPGKGSNSFDRNDLTMTVGSEIDVKAVFRKLTTTTAYAKTFGEKPASDKDFKVLQEKQFSKLPFSQILKPHIQEILNKWLMIND